MISKTKIVGLLAILPLLLTAIIANYANDTYALQSEGTSLPQTGSVNSPVCGDKLCSEVTTTSMNDKDMQKSMEGQYTYKQDFLPLKKN